jgi:glycosyltransferase involved in cell wall biosynthesis
MTKDSKVVWIINQYAGSPKHGMEFRHFYIARELVSQGHTVSIISSSYSHLFSNLPTIKGVYSIENIEGINYCWIKVINYGNASGWKRVLKWFQFAIRLKGAFKLLKKESKPDAIFLSSTSPIGVAATLKMANSLNSKFIFEVKDIWPLTLIEVGNKSPYHPLILLMGYLEKKALKNADIITSNLSNFGQHIKNLTIDKDFEYIPNGIDFTQMKNRVPLDKGFDKIIPPNSFVIGYAGTVGIANALEFVIKAMKQIKDKKIVLVIVGDGGEKESLQIEAANSDNIIFIPSVSKNQVQSIISLFDVCYIGWRAKKLYEFGISPNKLFDYMYSSTPILHSTNTPLDLVSLANCGLSVEAENVSLIKEGILKFYNMSSQERADLGANGKKYVIENHSYSELAKRYDSIV